MNPGRFTHLIVDHGSTYPESQIITMPLNALRWQISEKKLFDFAMAQSSGRFETPSNPG